MVISMKKIENIIENIKIQNDYSSDIKVRSFSYQNKKIFCLYLESVSSGSDINDFILKSIGENIRKNYLSFHLMNKLQNTISNCNMIEIKESEIFTYMNYGFTIIIASNSPKILALETRKDLSRGITESSSEGIIRGPKDSFTENPSTNQGLIRKRIRDENLIIKENMVGKRTKTKVSIFYIKDIADIQKVNKIMNKIKNIDVDGILDSGNIREFLFEHEHSVFPKVISTERPDLVCSSLLNGKIVIMVENSPYALIIPGLFVDFFKNPEDYYQSPKNVSFTRILRFLSFFITVMTPALYISITTFNIEVLPSTLLYSLYEQKINVPFPTSFEILLLLIIFEILRECDIRIPSAMGTSMSIVGGLVLGDAAVAAGIVAPISIIIVAVTSISGLLFSDIDMINAVRWWRIIFILFSTFLGMIGFFAAITLLVFELSSLNVLDIDYLTPISPFNKIGFKDTFLRPAKNKDMKRPSYLSDKNQTKLGGKV